MMKTITFLIFGFFCLNLYAVSITPYPISGDKRLRHASYSKNRVYNVNTKIGRATHIELEKGETLVKWFSGDSDAWEVGSHGNLIFFKPKVERPRTNMTVITNRRVYNFDFRLSNNYFYRVKFTYPGKRLTQEEKTHRLNTALADPDKQKNRATFSDYYYSGDKSIKPYKVYDNGSYTFFKFSRHKELPAIFLNGIFGETIANKKVKKNTIIVPRVARSWTLRLGKLAVCISKGNPSDYDWKSNTASFDAIGNTEDQDIP